MVAGKERGVAGGEGFGIWGFWKTLFLSRERRKENFQLFLVCGVVSAKVQLKFLGGNWSHAQPYILDWTVQMPRRKAHHHHQLAFL